MGLSDKDIGRIEEEEKELERMGIPTKIKSLDEQIAGYFEDRDTSKKVKARKNIGLGVTVGSDISKKPRLLKITTFGFEDGVLKHNMPCPVCLEEPAVYVSNEDGSYFAPCSSCEAEGFVLEKHKKTRGGFWG